MEPISIPFLLMQIHLGLVPFKCETLSGTEPSVSTQGCPKGMPRPPVSPPTLLAPVSPEVTTPWGGGASAHVFTRTGPHTQTHVGCPLVGSGFQEGTYGKGATLTLTLVC